MTDSEPVVVAPDVVEEINSDDDGVTKLWLDAAAEPVTGQVVKENIEELEETALPPSAEVAGAAAPSDHIDEAEKSALPPLAPMDAAAALSDHIEKSPENVEEAEKSALPPLAPMDAAAGLSDHIDQSAVTPLRPLVQEAAADPASDLDDERFEGHVDVVQPAKKPLDEAVPGPLTDVGATAALQQSEHAAVPASKENSTQGTSAVETGKDVEIRQSVAVPIHVVSEKSGIDDERFEAPPPQQRAYPFGPFAAVQAYPPPDLRSVFSKAAKLLTADGLSEENVRELRARLLKRDPVGHAFVEPGSLYSEYFEAVCEQERAEKAAEASAVITAENMATTDTGSAAKQHAQAVDDVPSNSGAQEDGELEARAAAEALAAVEAETTRRDESNGRVHLGMALEGLIEDKDTMKTLLDVAAQRIGALNHSVTQTKTALREQLRTGTEEVWVSVWHVVFMKKSSQTAAVKALAGLHKAEATQGEWHLKESLFEVLHRMLGALEDLAGLSPGGEPAKQGRREPQQCLEASSFQGLRQWFGCRECGEDA
eukprot:6157697-Amphidinium_carterae.6